MLHTCRARSGSDCGRRACRSPSQANPAWCLPEAEARGAGGTLPRISNFRRLIGAKLRSGCRRKAHLPGFPCEGTHPDSAAALLGSAPLRPPENAGTWGCFTPWWWQPGDRCHYHQVGLPLLSVSTAELNQEELQQNRCVCLHSVGRQMCLTAATSQFGSNLSSADRHVGQFHPVAVAAVPSQRPGRFLRHQIVCTC